MTERETFLLSLLGITEEAVPRYRDIYIDEGNLVLHTRTGGGNRAAYENIHSWKRECSWMVDDEEPSGPWNEDLRNLPGFLYDRDDEYDPTYADFYYELTDEQKQKCQDKGYLTSGT